MTHWGSLEGVVLGPWEREGAGRPDRGHRQGKGREPVVPTEITKAALTPLCHVFLSLSTEQLDLKKIVCTWVLDPLSFVFLCPEAVCALRAQILNFRDFSCPSDMFFERSDGQAHLDKTLCPLVPAFLQDDGPGIVLLLPLDDEQQLKAMVPGPHTNPRWDSDWSLHNSLLEVGPANCAHLSSSRLFPTENSEEFNSMSK